MQNHYKIGKLTTSELFVSNFTVTYPLTTVKVKLLNKREISIPNFLLFSLATYGFIKASRKILEKLRLLRFFCTKKSINNVQNWVVILGANSEQGQNYAKALIQQKTNLILIGENLKELYNSEKSDNLLLVEIQPQKLDQRQEEYLQAIQSILANKKICGLINAIQLKNLGCWYGVQTNSLLDFINYQVTFSLQVLRECLGSLQQNSFVVFIQDKNWFKMPGLELFASMARFNQVVLHDLKQIYENDKNIHFHYTTEKEKATEVLKTIGWGKLRLYANWAQMFHFEFMDYGRMAGIGKCPHLMFQNKQ